MSTKELVEQSRALLARVTPGRIEVVGECYIRAADGEAQYCRVATACDLDDADFIAFAMNNLPALLDALAAAEKRADEAEAGAAAMHQLVEEAYGVLRSLGGLHGMMCPSYDDDDGGECDCLLSNVAGPLRSAMVGAWDSAFLARLHAAEQERDDARAKLSEESALLRLAETRERTLERELLHIWSIVQPGEPTPPGEDHVRHAVADLRAEVERLKTVGDDLLSVARGCTDYGGGHHGECHAAFQHGIATVVNVLEKRLAGDDDYQMRVLKAIGSRADITGD